MDIPDAVKRFRQVIFKLDYKVKKVSRERRTPKGESARVGCGHEHTLAHTTAGMREHALW